MLDIVELSKDENYGSKHLVASESIDGRMISPGDECVKGVVNLYAAVLQVCWESLLRLLLPSSSSSGRSSSTT